MMQDYKEIFPRTLQLAEEGIARKLHTGMQFSLHLNEEKLNFTVGYKGEVQNSEFMTTETVLPWLSSAKPILVVALARLIEQGRCCWETPCYQFFPEWGYDNYKARLNLSHLLTHTAGLEEIDHGWPALNWDETLNRVINAPAITGIEPGERAAYSPQVNWFLLGEILCRLTRKDFESTIRELILDPLGMSETRCMFRQDDPLNTHRGDFYERVKGELVNHVFQSRIHAGSPSPGSSFCGPAHDLCKVMKLLLDQGKLNGENFLKQETIEKIATRLRVNMHDFTLQHKVDYGMGVIINSNKYGVETVPYGFGKHSSDLAFGHGGSQSSQSFADPAYNLCGVIIANGRAGEGYHQRRFREIMTSLYEDLELH